MQLLKILFAEVGGNPPPRVLRDARIISGVTVYFRQGGVSNMIRANRKMVVL